MKTFHVYQRADGRVTLEAREPKSSDTVLQSISAKNWGEAREKLRPKGFEQYEYRNGYGFYAEPTVA